jgi:hypothetical protein
MQTNTFFVHFIYSAKGTHVSYEGELMAVVDHTEAVLFALCLFIPF